MILYAVVGYIDRVRRIHIVYPHCVYLNSVTHVTGCKHRPISMYKCHPQYIQIRKQPLLMCLHSVAVCVQKASAVKPRAHMPYRYRYLRRRCQAHNHFPLDTVIHSVIKHSDKFQFSLHGPFCQMLHSLLRNSHAWSRQKNIIAKIYLF